ncbi:MAG: tetratricopeptide repeat protein [Nitrospira sp. CG24A]|nr:MAG: tetratricopeptide repeat protein [Nitrospira sp. CG24A]
MTSQERQAKTIKVLVLCVLCLWAFMSAEPIGLSQAASGTDEPPAFVAWPEKGLGLSIDLAGFKKDIDQVKPDGRRYLSALHHKTGLTVSVSLEKVPTRATAQGCIEQLQLIQKDPSVTHGQDIALNTTAAIPTLEYTLHKFRGVRLEHKHVHACLAQDNVYADIHLSKAHYTTADAPLFQSILKTIRLQPEPSTIIQATLPAPPRTIPIHPPAPPTSKELLEIGNVLYRQNKFAQAIPPYSKALDLETAEPQLDRTLWRALIDHLGMAYVMTGRLKEARALFEQGIQADPAYPIFHYNLACTFAELNELDHAMQSLKIAFRHRKNLNPGDKGMPDPRQNSSFERFMKHETFRNLVNDLTAAKS